MLFGEPALRNAVNEYFAHYHAERNQQGMENQLLLPLAEADRSAGELQQRERLGGMLK